MISSTQPRNEIVRVHRIVRPKQRRPVPKPVRHPTRQDRPRSRSQPRSCPRRHHFRAHTRSVVVPAPPPRSVARTVHPTTNSTSPGPGTGTDATTESTTESSTALPASIAKPRDHRVLLVLLPTHIRHLGRFLSAACKHGACVARSFAGPETRRVVVGRADEDVSEWVEGEGPDVGVVCLRERRAWD